MILFLDFDGVLHTEHDDGPTPDESVFCHLPRFEAVMRDFPTVEIVISLRSTNCGRDFRPKLLEN